MRNIFENKGSDHLKYYTLLVNAQENEKSTMFDKLPVKLMV
jgi:hypothetical protein